MRTQIFRSVILITTIFSTACASIHNGKFAEPEVKGAGKGESALGVVISGSENAALSSTYFGVVDFTFENRTSDWIRIKDITLDFGDEPLNKAIKIPVGSDLIAWAKAAEQRQAIRDYNTQLVLGSVMVLGAAVALGSNNSNLQSAGSIAFLGSTGGLAVMGFRDEKRRIELAKMVPADHLMSDDFVIPPGLHKKKWITFYTKEPLKLPRINTITIAYNLDNGQTERAKLNFRAIGSEWQRGKTP